MNKKEFMEELEDILQLDAGVLSEDLLIEEIPDFDSMAWLSIIAMLDEELNITVDVEALTSVKTVSQIMKLAGIQ